MTEEQRYIARYWKKMEDKGVQCVLCPRHCLLKNQQRGFCFVRQNIDGQLVLTTYGRSSGFCVDPIEKKPLNHFYPGSSVLSFGTAGCNLGCRFCQNWDISRSREFDRLSAKASPNQIALAAKNGGCKSVAFTYNDPVIFAEYAIDIAKECHEIGIKTVAVTAGYIQGQAREDFFLHMDAANVDLKSFSERFYKEKVLGTLQPVLDTLMYIKKETKTWLEITTLLIPGENDSPEEIEALSSWVFENLGKDVPMHFTAFHPDFKMRDIPPTPFAKISEARDIARKVGMKYVYTGNVFDKVGGSTFCDNCGDILIERNGYILGQYNLLKDKCKTCASVCAGYFDEKPGSWGSKRMPIQI